MLTGRRDFHLTPMEVDDRGLGLRFDENGLGYIQFTTNGLLLQSSFMYGVIETPPEGYVDNSYSFRGKVCYYICN